MAYITPPLRATGDLITPTIWNQDVRANWQAFEAHGHDGTSGGGASALGPLSYVDFTDAVAPAAPGVGKTRLYAVSGKPRFRASSTGNDTPLLYGGTSYRLVVTDASGEQVLLAFGASGTVLTSSGSTQGLGWATMPAYSWVRSFLLSGG